MLTIITHWLALLGASLLLLVLGGAIWEVFWTWRNDPATTAHFARARLVGKLIMIGVIVLALFLIAITFKVYTL